MLDASSSSSPHAPPAGGRPGGTPPPTDPLRHRPSPLPEPRGAVSEWLVAQLSGTDVGHAPEPDDDPLTGEDTHVALATLYELAYRGVEGVDETREWDLDLLRVRAALEDRFYGALRESVGPLPAVDDVPAFLQELTGNGDGPSVSATLAREPHLGRLQEQAIHRAFWQLKEADPHSWAIPRLAGRPKAALVEIQADEYGGGVEQDIHAELYALSMERLGLSSAYNAYLEAIPGVSLATVNLVSMFGLHRRWLGALTGHLAVFEMSSTTTMAAYATALRALDFDPWTCLFYDTHVVADAHHQTVAATELVGGLLEQDPHRTADVVFGALAIETVEGALTEHLLSHWERGDSSLRVAVTLPDPAPGQLLDPLPADDPRLPG
jgi:hypothetical protein